MARTSICRYFGLALHMHESLFIEALHQPASAGPRLLEQVRLFVLVLKCLDAPLCKIEHGTLPDISSRCLCDLSACCQKLTALLKIHSRQPAAHPSLSSRLVHAACPEYCRIAKSAKVVLAATSTRQAQRGCGLIGPDCSACSWFSGPQNGSIRS